MLNTRDRQYIFRTTRFHCGCVYQTIDNAVFCPEHRRDGFITSQETIRTPDSSPPRIQGLAMNTFAPSRPKVLRNDDRNSLHVMTSVLDGRKENWTDDEVQEVGLCTACFIDLKDNIETEIAMCECGSEDCSYRWCGRLDGLHALWRLHAQGLSPDSIGTPEEDIFSYGPFWEKSEETREILSRERDHLREADRKLAQEAILARQAALPQAGRRHISPVLMSHWMDPEIREMEQETDPRRANWALSRLEAKMARLYVIGAVAPEDQHEEGEEGQTTPQTP